LEDHNRHRFLLDNSALATSGWLPPASEVPALAHLRADHDRLIDAVAETSQAFMQLKHEQSGQLEARRAAQEQAFRGGAPEALLPEVTITDAMISEAVERSQIARDALQTFAQEAVAEITSLERQLLGQIGEVRAAAVAKRAEAARIMAEADTAELSTKKLSNWLGRATGRNPLGHYSYEQLPTPVPMPDQQRTLADLSEANAPAFEMVELEGPFGTDHPDNLDADATPWAIELPKEANV
jgi:hypothetical protein